MKAVIYAKVVFSAIVTIIVAVAVYRGVWLLNPSQREAVFVQREAILAVFLVFAAIPALLAIAFTDDRGGGGGAIAAAIAAAFAFAIVFTVVEAFHAFAFGAAVVATFASAVVATFVLKDDLPFPYRWAVAVYVVEALAIWGAISVRHPGASVAVAICGIAAIMGLLRFYFHRHPSLYASVSSACAAS